jgi:hypothetical protein
LEGQDDTIRALSDTVLDIKDTVDGHTRTLAEHSRVLGQIQTTQDQQGQLLAEILRRLPG